MAHQVSSFNSLLMSFVPESCKSESLVTCWYRSFLKPLCHKKIMIFMEADISLDDLWLMFETIKI